MSNELTPRQREVLDFIRRYSAEHGYPPTRLEIARHFGFKVAASAQEHLQALAAKGAIALVPGNARGIRLLSAEEEGVPLVGRVAAGRPILAAEHIERRYRLPPGLFRPMPDYLLRVQGESMRDAGILDGDLLAVRRRSLAEARQIVVARLGEEVTVKRLRREGGRLFLDPAHPDFRPIEVSGREDFLIEGVAVGLIRRLE
jgi:repressor LexA